VLGHRRITKLFGDLNIIRIVIIADNQIIVDIL